MRTLSHKCCNLRPNHIRRYYTLIRYTVVHSYIYTYVYTYIHMYIYIYTRMHDICIYNMVSPPLSTFLGVVEGATEGFRGQMPTCCQHKMGCLYARLGAG